MDVRRPTYLAMAKRYAEQVVAGEIVACRWVLPIAGHPPIDESPVRCETAIRTKIQTLHSGPRAREAGHDINYLALNSPTRPCPCGV